MRTRLALALLAVALTLTGCAPLLVLRAKSLGPPHHQALRDHVREHAQSECGTCHKSLR